MPGRGVTSAVGIWVPLGSLGFESGPIRDVFSWSLGCLVAEYCAGGVARAAEGGLIVEVAE